MDLKPDTKETCAQKRVDQVLKIMPTILGSSVNMIEAGCRMSTKKVYFDSNQDIHMSSKYRDASGYRPDFDLLITSHKSHVS